MSKAKNNKIEFTYKKDEDELSDQLETDRFSHTQKIYLASWFFSNWKNLCSLEYFIKLAEKLHIENPENKLLT